ncbi:hypothetical protein HYV86_07910 [Candidatus Woesearchaeota archaeon]|nr:hypothetical protein [Candidatus Woesearchaeota archaeon]
MQQKKVEDISNRTVLTVLVVIILVSVVSLAIYLSALDKAVPVVIYGADGEVSLNVDSPATFNPETMSDSEKAKVSVGIDSPNQTQNQQNAGTTVQ